MSRGYHVVLKTREAVILHRGQTEDFRLFKVGRKFAVAASPFYKLSGKYVAYSADLYDENGEELWTVVRNLATGRFPHTAPVYKDNRCFPPTPDDPFQVWRADTRARKLVDKGVDVARYSLRRTRSTITWLDGDTRRSAVLR